MVDRLFLPSADENQRRMETEWDSGRICYSRNWVYGSADCHQKPLCSSSYSREEWGKRHGGAMEIQERPTVRAWWCLRAILVDL